MKAVIASIISTMCFCQTNETFSLKQMQIDDHAIDKLFVTNSIPQDM